MRVGGYRSVTNVRNKIIDGRKVATILKPKLTNYKLNYKS